MEENEENVVFVVENENVYIMLDRQLIICLQLINFHRYPVFATHTIY